MTGSRDRLDVCFLFRSIQLWMLAFEVSILVTLPIGFTAVLANYEGIRRRHLRLVRAIIQIYYNRTRLI